MMRLKPCSALITIDRSAEGLVAGYKCRNGFPIRISCHGGEGVPVCMDEKTCGHLYSECGGWPLAKGNTTCQ